MAYVLIPDGFTLKKVTTAERNAVDEYFGRERKGTYLEAFLANENTPLLAGGIGLLALSPVIFNLFQSALEEQNIILSDAQLDLVKKGFEASLLVNPVTGGPLIGKKLFDFVQEQIEK